MVGCSAFVDKLHVLLNASPLVVGLAAQSTLSKLS
jgi:hypothetical protein